MHVLFCRFFSIVSCEWFQGDNDILTFSYQQGVAAMPLPCDSAMSGNSITPKYWSTVWDSEHLNLFELCIFSSFQFLPGCIMLFCQVDLGCLSLLLCNNLSHKFKLSGFCNVVTFYIWSYCCCDFVHFIGSREYTGEMLN